MAGIPRKPEELTVFINPRLPLVLIGVLALAACGGGEAPAPAPEAEPEAKAAAGSDAGAAGATGLSRTASPADARVYFVTPADGATVTSPVRVEFGLDGMDVVPAGTQQPMSGHHHVIIDTELPPFDLPIPADANHVHYGDGSTSTELTLEPGEHRLQLLLGDHLHIPHAPPVYSDPITITVEAAGTGSD